MSIVRTSLKKKVFIRSPFIGQNFMETVDTVSDFYLLNFHDLSLAIISCAYVVKASIDSNFSLFFNASTFTSLKFTNLLEFLAYIHPRLVHAVLHIFHICSMNLKYWMINLIQLWICYESKLHSSSWIYPKISYHIAVMSFDIYFQALKQCQETYSWSSVLFLH